MRALEAGIGVAVLGSVLAVAVPTFVRNMSSSRLVEATSGLARIDEHALAYASGRACADAFPTSAPLTPAIVPRGKAAVDADPNAWEHPTWKALDFRPVAPNVAHSYAFAFDQKPGSFIAHAHGDLDGNGTTSTFETHGKCGADGASIAPGMYVEAEYE